MELEDIELIEMRLFNERYGALGARFDGICDPVLEEAYRRLWMGLEIISWDQPTGWLGWSVKKFGFLSRAEGLSLLTKSESASPQRIRDLWKGMAPKKRPHYYWRTKLISQFLKALRPGPESRRDVGMNHCRIPIQSVKWVADQDPLLYRFFVSLLQPFDDNDPKDLVALGVHYDFECRLGRSVSLMEVMRECESSVIGDYLVSKKHWVLWSCR